MSAYRPMLLLHTGEKVDARSAYYRWELLPTIRASDPIGFEALMAISADGDITECIAGRDKALRHYGDMFRADGTIKPIFRKLLSSTFAICEAGDYEKP